MILGNYSLNLKSLIRFFFLLIILNLLTTLLLDVLANEGWLIYNSHPSVISFKEASGFQSKIFMAISAVIVFPIVEEISFRWFLVNRGKSIVLGVSCFISLFLSMVISSIWGAFNSEFGFLTLFFLIFFILRYTIVNKALEQVTGFIIKIVDQHLYLWIAFTSLAFSIIHWRVTATPTTLIAYPVVFLPYFVSSLVYSFARIKNGVSGSIILHAAFNTLVLSLNMLV